MPLYCPNCHTEYNEGIKTCSACRVDLIAELIWGEDGRKENNFDIVPVYDALDQISAHAISSFLNSNGVGSVVKSEQIPMYDGVAMMLFPRWGRVMVLENQYEKAKALIDQYLAGKSVEEEE